jgi:hypothetical protein
VSGQESEKRDHHCERCAAHGTSGGDLSADYGTVRTEKSMRCSKIAAGEPRGEGSHFQGKLVDCIA